MSYSDIEAATALIKVIGSSRWAAVGIAHGFAGVRAGASDDDAARLIYGHGSQTLRKARELVGTMKTAGFLGQLTPRERTGAAADPVPKLFPGRITEERFLELIDGLRASVKGLDYTDTRNAKHGLDDFSLVQGDSVLPINVKVASTRFERAAELVHLDPTDCIPIPAYKAHAAIEKFPSLVYAVSVDYNLIRLLSAELPNLLSSDEAIVWDLIGKFHGALVMDAEDAFVFEVVRKYWDKIKPLLGTNPFHIISARKAIRVLQTRPERTPGIGMRGWGTGASAEVNVHISVKGDTTPWHTVAERIQLRGLGDVIGAVNRKRVEEVYDPEI